jgi:hypothetical protein
MRMRGMPIQYAPSKCLLPFRILPTADGGRLPQKCSNQPVVSLGFDRGRSEDAVATGQINAGYTCIKTQVQLQTVRSPTLRLEVK